MEMGSFLIVPVCVPQTWNGLQAATRRARFDGRIGGVGLGPLGKVLVSQGTFYAFGWSGRVGRWHEDAARAATGS